MATGNYLLDYLDQADEAFHWEIRSHSRQAEGTLYEVALTSQVWQGIHWTHALHLYVPDQIAFTDIAWLTIGADAPLSPGRTTLDFVLADSVQTVFAHLYNVPNQPLFDGLREDELIAHTLTQYLDTADATWPILFPMVKSAVCALDAIQQILAQQAKPSPTRFVVHGASKRGWTTWLLAVSDRRVAAIIPEVYDNLNLFAQMPHQMEVWETYSEMIEDYTEARLQEKMRTPMGYEMAMTVDPYTYREKLTLPKLLLHGTNDRYWATDAMTLYWDDLAGAKYALYAPNQEHHILERSLVRRTLAAFARAVAAHSSLPELRWEFDTLPETFRITLTADDLPVTTSVWIATSANQDFRTSRWEEILLTLSPDSFSGTGEIARPTEGYIAVIGQAKFGSPSEAFGLTTPVRILTSA